MNLQVPVKGVGRRNKTDLTFCKVYFIVNTPLVEGSGFS
ncbi:MAG: hypothetical protein KatS3mg100_502 [Candidatus Parcubacteria bacterium]|nr:MAG: hypothetical protein KatS3mg100_502 [Candidatus Parcubacteria bacterium]